MSINTLPLTNTVARTINDSGKPFVKRVQKQLNGTVAITSDNKNYDDIVIASDDLNTLKIIGRVIWSGHPMI